MYHSDNLRDWHVQFHHWNFTFFWDLNSDDRFLLAWLAFHLICEVLWLQKAIHLQSVQTSTNDVFNVLKSSFDIMVTLN